LGVSLSAEGERLRLSAPKGVLTDNLRAQIAARKQELLEFLRNRTRSFGPPAISRRAGGSASPLSFAQERLWFLEQWDPGAAVYNICRASRLSGRLNLAALELSLNEIVRRHEVLRSAIRVIEGRPVQTIEPPYTLNLTVVDLQSTSEAEREREIENQIRQAAEAPFDFVSGKFLRAELLGVAVGEHILILTTHHIVSDAWSMGILTRELWSLYEAYATNQPSPLQDPDFQYADFANWQRNWLQGEVLESQLSYWKRQLNDLPILNLPTDRPRPARQSFRGARQSIALGQPLTKAINELSHRERATPFMTLLAAFQVLVYRYCGQEDVVVGSPIANRRRFELESLIGFFVNSLVLRADLSGNPTFKEALARVRDVCLGAYAHQDLPFEKLVEELKPERDQSRNPLFQVMFALQNATRPFGGIYGLRIEPVELPTARSLFDLSLFLRERKGRYVGYIEYSTDLFDRDRIERMTGHFRILLEGIVADPDRRIAVLPMLTQGERHQLLVEWNDTAADYPKNKCIHELFEEQVERTPDLIAVAFQGQHLTYRELNARANQLAHHLRGLGVGPEKLVGICVERSLEMVIGLLGILKAGGAYVPLDPTYPSERLKFMLEDAQASLVITLRSWARDHGPLGRQSGRLSAGGDLGGVVCLDRDWQLIERESAENPKTDVAADNLAYVIYTSGSTGQPKGVAVEHRNTVNLLRWAKNIYTSRDLESVLASTSICFDLSVFELFVPLSWGGKIVLAENALSLIEHKITGNVTLINTVPSAMTAVLAAGRLPDAVRVVNLAGEPLRPDLVGQLYDSGNVDEVYDLYGPTETTTYSTFTLRSANGRATIGKPIADTRIYILDGYLQPVPVGVAGEIVIGGSGVARGYLNRPELTAERFIANCFGPRRDDRLYRTGDRGRYLRNGDIEFVGRMDNQVKIRGYRIELGEVEVVLREHPRVKESVVVAVNDGSSLSQTGTRSLSSAQSELPERSDNPQSLVAYVVPKTEAALSDAELRSFLKAKLPLYMVPEAVVVLGALPVSATGKIDRSRLPMLKPLMTDVAVVPRTEIEQLLVQIWRDVLHLKTVGIHDNFFALGGHSLLAIQVVSRVREVFGKALPLAAIFDAPTIAALATTIEEAISGRPDDLPPITRVPRDGPLPLTMNQEHLWRLDRMIPGTPFFNMPYVYRLSGKLNIAALEHALHEIVTRHESLRTVFGEVAGRPVQIIRPTVDFHLPVIDLQKETVDNVRERAALLIAEERERPFDLTEGPLFRTGLVRLTTTEHILLLTLHHIIADYSSIRVICQEIGATYSATVLGRETALPEPRIQAADYACWERRLLEEGWFESHLEYWKKQIAPLPGTEIGLNGEAEREPSLLDGRRAIMFDETTFAGITALAKAENCTPFMIVIATLSALFYSQFGQQDIRIGTLVANRGRRETETMIGCLLNTVVLRVRISPSTTLMELLSQVRQVAIAGYVHQQLPFEYLARALEREAPVNRQSLFWVQCNYQTSDMESLEIPGLRFAPWNLGRLEGDPGVALTTLNLIFDLRASPKALTGSVSYKRSIFSEGQIADLISYFQQILRSLISGNARTCSLLLDLV
jgi:amino acid adenylation domain-containing protein